MLHGLSPSSCICHEIFIPSSRACKTIMTRHLHICTNVFLQKRKWYFQVAFSLSWTSPVLLKLLIAFSKNERTYPNFVSLAREIETFCEDCKLAAPLIFSGALGLVFVYIDSSPLGLLRIHNHDFLFSFLRYFLFFSIITLHNALPNVW